MKKSAIVLACLLWFTLSVNAQQARSDIKANVNLAASNYLAYPGPQKTLQPVTNRSISATMAAMGRAIP